MTTRGPKRGTLQQGSLAAKLLNTRIGETLYLDDAQSLGKATVTERAVRNVIAKSPALAGLTFATARWVAVRSNPIEARAILAVKRLS